MGSTIQTKIHDWIKALYYNHDAVKVRKNINSTRNKKIQELEHLIVAVKAKTTSTDTSSNSESDSSYSASQIKEKSKNIKSNVFITRYGAGNYRPVTQTNNKIIKRVTSTQYGLKIDQYTMQTKHSHNVV